MKKKNAFTLIELLAIIVILAIIAVITVPIILNIIENSRKGAAADSAYGYKDAVNKYYVQELSSNNKLKLNDTYTVTNGTLSGGSFGDENVTSFPVQVSGTVPSSGELIYENNVLMSGCLVIGDYAVTFEDGNVKNTEKGNCSPVLPSMAEMCPGCVYKFIQSEEQFYIGSQLTENEYVEDYNELGKSVFVGLILDGEKRITRGFACGINGSTPFCIESYSGTNDSIDKKNKRILYTIFGNTYDETTYTGCIIDEHDGIHSIMCSGNSIGANYTFDGPYAGGVDTHDYDEYNFMCVDAFGIWNNLG